MFKFSQAFFLLEMLVATAQGIDLSIAGIQPSQADLKSDVKALQDLVQDLRTRRYEQIEKSSPSQNVQSSKSPTCDQTKVAFFAGLSKTIGPVAQDIDVVFDNVVTNNGSAFSAWSGRFAAPVRATYQFSVTLSATHHKSAAVRLLKNGVGILEIWSVATPIWAPSSNVAILSLEPGDQVWLQLVQRASDVYGGMCTTFSGFLIFEN